MVILQVQPVDAPACRSERHAPVAGHRDAPLVAPVAGQPMDAPPRGGIRNEVMQVLRQHQCSQDLAYTVAQLAGEVANAVLFKQATQPSVPNRLDDHLGRQCTVSPFIRQRRIFAAMQEDVLGDSLPEEELARWEGKSE